LSLWKHERVRGVCQKILEAQGWRLAAASISISRRTAADKAGRFAVELKQPGSVFRGLCFLQPGSWGRFKDLPVRKDVAWD